MSDERINKYAKIMMDEWWRVEGAPPSASYVANFADMARAVLTEIDNELEEAKHKGYTEGYDEGYSYGMDLGYESGYESGRE